MKRIEELKMRIGEIFISLVRIKNKLIYKIKKKICDLRYRRLTYVHEKGMWISTVVFPVEIVDGIYGITDVFAGKEKQVDFMPLHSVYIKKISESGNIHRDVVKCVKSGYILKNEVGTI